MMRLYRILARLTAVIIFFGFLYGPIQDSVIVNAAPGKTEADLIQEISPFELFDYGQIPAYSSYASVMVNNNIPFFSDAERAIWVAGTEYYSPLDSLGRCGVTYACLGVETMPKDGEVRGEIGMVKPSGWQTVKYPEVIADRYLYNRCHLIGWQLGNENANVQNLITGTRYLNIEGMLPYENLVADYIKNTNHHVLYRVTPYFVGDELVARGVLIEAESVEDKNIQFCVWCYNVQPCVEINYSNGTSIQISNVVPIIEAPITVGAQANTTSNALQQTDIIPVNREGREYILNTRSHKVHFPECSSVSQMAEHNKQNYYGTVEELQKMGYTACGNCHPF